MDMQPRTDAGVQSRPTLAFLIESRVDTEYPVLNLWHWLNPPDVIANLKFQEILLDLRTKPNITKYDQTWVGKVKGEMAMLDMWDLCT